MTLDIKQQNTKRYKSVARPAFFYIYKLFLFFCIGLTVSLSAQEIRGKVTDENGRGLKANLIIKKNKVPVAFQFSDASGDFAFSANDKWQNQDSLQLEVRSDGLQTVVEDFVYTSGEDMEFYITLIEPIIALEDIYIEAKRTPIKLKKDTTEYNADSFADGSERAIEDLIKKLPGVRVEEDGKIKFKGKEISKLLIEGDDLFDRNYVTGSRNISVDVVDKIQAIENWSENELLKGIEQSSKIAMNIVMKPDVIDLSGDATLGYGISDKYQGKINAIFLKKNQKNFTTASYNNSGHNYAPYNYLTGAATHYPQDLDYLNQASFIHINNFYLDLPQKRYRINQAWFTNTNHIFKASDKFTSRLIFNFYRDKLNFQKLTQESYFLADNQALEQITSASSEKQPIFISPQLKFTWKTSDNTLIDANLEFAKENIKTKGNVLNNLTYDTHFKLKNSHQHTLGNFNLTHKISDGLALDIQAVLADIRQGANFDVQPAPDIQTGEIDQRPWHQNMNNDRAYYRLKTNVLGAVNEDNKYEIGFKSTFQKDNLYTQLLKSNTRISQNALRLNNWSNEIKAKHHLKTGRFTLNPSFKLMHQHIDYTQENDSIFNELSLAPELSIHYKTGKFSHIFVTGNYGQNLLPIEKLYENYILINHRDYERYDGQLFYQKSWENSLGYTYDQMYDAFQIMTSVFYSNNKNLFLSDYQIRPNSNLRSHYFHNDATQSFGALGLIEKLVMPIESTLRLTTSYAKVEALNRVNATELRRNFLHIWNTEFFVKSAFDILFNFDNVLNYKVNMLDTNGAEQFVISSWSNEFNTYWRLNDAWFLQTTWDWYHRAQKDFHFLDFNLRYQNSDVFEITLKAENLLNVNQYTESYGSRISTAVRRQTINERYIMLLLHLRF